MNSAGVDVAVIGGGPAGATLAARLAREGRLSVLVLEAEHFPRDRIGESLASPAVPCLAESRVIGKVLAGDCTIRKYGGFYAWDRAGPAVSFFRHRLWERDGIHRWSMHVNRPRFDQILLDHAADSGAAVRQGEAVTAAAPRPGGGHVVSLASGASIDCRYLVDCSGRLNRAQRGRDGAGERAWLSSWRNVALWTHVRGGRMAQTLAGDWNIFREPDLSPIGCFAFNDGWVWYIPIPHRHPNGTVEIVHSLGLVTEGEGLERRGRALLSSAGLLAAVRDVPLLRDLISDAVPLYPASKRATNYSMVRERLCDAEHRWIAVGDAAFFVDPLFSSGVSFALQQGGAAADLILRGEAEGGVIDPVLWDDYSASWRRVAQNFAWGIDQWYAAIADAHPDSIYWNRRADGGPKGAHMNSLGWLLDTDFETDLLHVVSRGRRSLAEASGRGAMMSAANRLSAVTLPPSGRARLRRGARVERSRTMSPRHGPATGTPSVWDDAAFWQDPEAHMHDMPTLSGQPADCVRVRREDAVGAASEDDLILLNATPAQRRFLGQLEDGGMDVEEIETDLPPELGAVALRLIAGGFLEIASAA